MTKKAMAARKRISRKKRFAMDSHSRDRLQVFGDSYGGVFMILRRVMV